jgi:hypothetical protein
MTMPLQVEALFNDYGWVGAFTIAGLLSLLALLTLLVKLVLERRVGVTVASGTPRLGLRVGLAHALGHPEFPDGRDHDGDIVIGGSQEFLACWPWPRRAEQRASGTVGAVEQDGQQQPVFDVAEVA